MAFVLQHAATAPAKTAPAAKPAAAEPPAPAPAPEARFPPGTRGAGSELGVTVVAARGLLAKDETGFSDPFCEVGKTVVVD